MGFNNIQRRNCQTVQLDAEDSLAYHVRLVLDSDVGTAAHVEGMVEEHLAAKQPCPFSDGNGRETGQTWDDGGANARRVETGDDCGQCSGAGEIPLYPHELGDRLKEFCEEIALPDTSAGVETPMLARELITTALGWVDWIEVAVIYIKDAQAEVNA